MSITKEQNLILTILRDHVNGLKTNIEDAEAVDWERVYTLVQRQQLAAIVYAQTKKDSFERAYLFQISRSVRMDAQLHCFEHLMDGLEYFFIKGACLKDCYPISQLRSMGDVDVVIHSEDREAVHHRLIEAGFVFQKAWEEEWVYEKDDIIYEIHDRLVVSREGNKAHDDFAMRVWDYVNDNELNWNYHFIYVLTHLRKHLLGHGVGLRQFMDIAVMCKYKKGLDWNWITSELEQLGMIGFARQVMAFNERAFAVKPPIEVDPIEEGFYQEAVERIFRDGVFGHDSKDEKSVVVAKIMRTQGIDKVAARKQMLVRRLFPSYKQLMGYYYLRYLDGRKYLLPVAWVHRAFYRLCSRRCREDVIEMFHTEREDINKQYERLSKWGL